MKFSASGTTLYLYTTEQRRSTWHPDTFGPLVFRAYIGLLLPPLYNTGIYLNLWFPKSLTFIVFQSCGSYTADAHMNYAFPEI